MTLRSDGRFPEMKVCHLLKTNNRVQTVMEGKHPPDQRKYEGEVCIN